MPGTGALLLALFAIAPLAAQTRWAQPAAAPVARSALGAAAAPAPAPALLPPAAAALSAPASPLPAPAAALEPAAAAPVQALAVSAPAVPIASPASSDGGPRAARGPPALEGLAAPLPETLGAPAGKASASTLKADSDADFARRLGEEPPKLNVLMVGAESVPYAKTGGLADVVDAVSRGLAQRGHNVALVLPKYRQIDAAKHGIRRADLEVKVPIGGELVTARVWTGQRGGVTVYLLENDELHSPDGYYAPRKPGYSDDDERFIFLARGALEAAKALGFKPDVVHAHDWHSALIAPMLKLIYGADPFFAATKSVLTLHNLAYQGMFPPETLARAGFDMKDFTWDRLEYWGNFNFLKAGLAFADALTTVSRTYAREIQESNEFGRGMEGLLRFRAADLSGILNGIDPALWDPAADRDVRRPYTWQDVTAGKAANKAALQEETGLVLDPRAPLFAVASRFDAQKGLDLVARGAQIVVSGSGDPKLTEAFHALARSYPRNVFVHPFSETFVHKVYAAADFMLMPSRFEPCGLTQLISQRYGTLPIVARTGGLADTVVDITDHPGKGDGFFMREFSAAGLLEAVDRAIALRARKGSYLRSRRVAMAKDSSWSRAIEQYERLFTRLAGRKP